MHVKRRKPDAARGEHGSDEAVRYLTRTQVELLTRAAAGNPRLAALVALLLDSGARISEALALDVRGVDLDQGQFQVVGKGNKRRWCYFGPTARELLSRYLRGGRHHPHGALFTERGVRRNNVRRLTYAAAYRDLRQACARHPGLAGVRFHELRHTFATERASLVPLEVLRALLGHEKIQTTLIYQKITSQVAREAAQQALQKLAR